MSEWMPTIYEGHDDYVFVSYAHADRDVALPIIRALVAEGYRVWYDDGVQKGSKYPDYIADHVYRCSRFVALLSESSKASEWCDQEVHFALNLHKWVLPVYLDEVELDLGLRMRLVTTQAMYWHHYVVEAAFLSDLFAVKMLDCCLTGEGKQRRGVKPRNGGVEADQTVTGKSESLQAESNADSKVAPKAEATPKTASRVRPKTEPAVEPATGLTTGPNSGLTNEPKNESVVEPKIEFTTEPTTGPVREGVQGAGTSQRATARASSTAGQRIDETNPVGREMRYPHVIVSDKLVGTVSVAKKDKLADYSWAELKELSRAIAAAGSDEKGLTIARVYGLVDKDGRLRGETKSVVVRGWKKTKTSVRILGFRHDELVCGGKAGISFEFAGVPARYQMNAKRTNDGGWERSEMRSWLNSDFLALLPDDLRESVAEARKRTSNRGYIRRENDTSVVTETADRLWLLSMSEVYGRFATQSENVPPSPVTYDAEGAQYKLYADKGVSAASYDSCKKRGARSWWWLRSPRACDSDWFLVVNADGDWNWLYAGSDWGVSPGFCF